MSKIDYKKDFKELYLPPTKPVLVDVPGVNYFMIDGRGNPNSEGFSDDVEALYTLSYMVKMMPKKGTTPEGYYEYTVFPLEGVWDLDDEGRKLQQLDKEHLVYTIAIRQPDFVNDELAQTIIERARKEKPKLIPVLDRMRFGSITDGLCVQMMHLGSYDDEPANFAQMAEWCADNGYTRSGLIHREIYISDPKRTTPEKLKTVLRIFVKKN